MATLKALILEKYRAPFRLLAPKPANLSMREAAALPLVFITAWEGLVDRVDLPFTAERPGTRRRWR